jgi:DNA-binding Lrp family transcriptional regulator
MFFVTLARSSPIILYREGMTTISSTQHPSGGAQPKDLRPDLDEIDVRLLREVAAHARTPNNALADAAGVAPSTAHARLRALQDTGVIRGFHADIDPARVGRSLQAMICVRMQGHSRAKLSAYLRGLARLPGVLNVYLLGGAHDFFIHVAVPDTEALNDFVIEHLSANPDVALTETNLIFQHAHAPAFH